MKLRITDMGEYFLTIFATIDVSGIVYVGDENAYIFKRNREFFCC
jgi:hypothetical protein